MDDGADPVWSACDAVSSASTPRQRAAVPAEQYLRGTMPDLYDENVRLQEYIERRDADWKLRELLAAADFAGPRYRRFEEEISAYGLAVLRAWMRTGYIFTLTAQLGYYLDPTPAEIEELARDPEARHELADMTIALTLPAFRQRALVEGGWRVDGGAAIATYFTGAALRVFVNEFRKRRRYQQKWQTNVCQDIEVWPMPSSAGDPEIIAINGILIRDHLSSLDSRTRAVLKLVLDGYSQQEITEMLGLVSIKAVEGLLRRWRAAAKRALAGGGSS
ncbi:RNA polymerase sigma factor [Krasilnikovia sp. M28-CT-15]|uniref:RNA polymerase sigma factor n=1 Tax=Krasilnikovia sp. M28-CT-15 TaxID=3373540 RepID=UPI00387736B2